VVLPEAERLTPGQLEHTLGVWCERDLPLGHPIAAVDDPLDLRANALRRDVEVLEHPRREALVFTQQAEQEMLAADVVMAERSRFFLGENDDLPGSLGEA